MIISNANDGQKAGYSLSGNVLTVGNVSIDLQDKQKTNERVIDICLDNQLETMREGMGAWYVANVIVPAKKYSFQPTGEKDEEGNDIMEEVELPVDLPKVELRLWGLPPQYFETTNQTQETLEQGAEA
ncbi:AAA family ATPase [Oceanobacillus sp. CF4.6]|uniref:AAA family ATPase n=1 Tax=Oceanobacillus sp. CF4.6 TaxID=3373080 RepID=UPI003EE6B095